MINIIYRYQKLKFSLPLIFILIIFSLNSAHAEYYIEAESPCGGCVVHHYHHYVHKCKLPKVKPHKKKRHKIYHCWHPCCRVNHYRDSCWNGAHQPVWFDGDYNPDLTTGDDNVMEDANMDIDR